jgi:hypothetical protein
MILSTLLYDGNIDELLSDSGWFLNFKSPVIQRKLIIINNVHDRQLTENKIISCTSKHNNIEYFFVSDFEQAAIDFFKLDIDKYVTKGYYYIIPYFALMYKLRSGFIFHVSDDCMKELKFSDSFLIESMKEISNNSKIPVTTLGWGLPKSSMGYDVGEWEQIETFRLKQKTESDMESFWHSIGFVDQVFIASIEKLIDFDYNLGTHDNPIYHGPWYCPDSWEQRVAEYMYKNDMYRGVWKTSNEYYIHPGHKL